MQNLFIEFPRVLCQLPQLEWLNLQLNQIGYVPPDILSCFPAMCEMNVSNKPFRTIHGIIQADLRGPYHVLEWGSFNYVQLTPRAMEWLHHYQESRTRYDLEDYYSKSVGEMTIDLVGISHPKRRNASCLKSP